MAESLHVAAAQGVAAPPGHCHATRAETRRAPHERPAPCQGTGQGTAAPPPRPVTASISERARSAARCSRRAARRAYFLLCPKDSSNTCIAVARFLPPYLDFFWDKPVNPDLYDSCRRRRGFISGGGAGGSGGGGWGWGGTDGGDTW